MIRTVFKTLKRGLSKNPDPLKIIFMGAPASGKGTQCEKIVEKFGVVHISTGQVLRENINEGTPLGIVAEAYISRGDLIPDDLACDIVVEKLSSQEVQSNGFLLDGFPRTEFQANYFLEQLGDVNIVLNLLCPDDIVVERIEGRRYDPVTGNTYHAVYNPPKDEEVLNRVIHRDDDKREVILKRLKEYHKNESLLEVFGNVVAIDGHQAMEKVTMDIFEALEVEVEGI